MANSPESWKYHSGAGRQRTPRQTVQSAQPVRRTPAKRTAPRRSSLETRYAPQAQKRQVRRPATRQPTPRPVQQRANPPRPVRRRRRSSLLPWALAALVSCLILGFTWVWSVGQTIPAGADASTPASQAEPAPAPSVGECVFRSGGDELPREVQDTLTEWFVRCYDAAARLEAPELDDLYGPGAAAQEACLLDEASVDFISRVRAMQPVDLTMTGFTIGLTVEETSWEGETITVSLQEDDQIQFAFLNGRTSSSCGIENTFTFSADGKILAHEKTEDGFNLVRDVYSRQSSGGESTIQSTLSQMMSAAKADVDKLASQRQQYLADPSGQSSLQTCDMDYDRQAAVAYARQWVGLTAMTRNPKWGIYDDYGGNCNNFTSQCLYAGGIPMDIYGYDTQQWKWYSDVPNSYSEARGRSSSWSGVDEFYTYVNENSGYGLVAEADGNLYTAQPGDVLQYGADGEWKHSVLVTEVVNDANGQPVEFLIASNTTDRIDWPMSAYAYADVRLIHVLGYNN